MTPSRKNLERKLYKQWVEHGHLPPKAPPEKERPIEAPPEKERPIEAFPEKERPIEAPPKKERPRDVLVGSEKRTQRLRVLYILLGVGIFALCAGSALLFIQSC